MKWGFAQAAAIVGDGASTHGGSPAYDNARIMDLGDYFNPFELIPWIAEGLTDWLISKLQPLNELVERLKGEPDVIASHADQLRSFAAHLSGHASSVSNVASATASGWHSPASKAADHVLCAHRDCDAAFAGLGTTMGDTYIALATTMSSCRRACVRFIIAAVMHLVKEALLAALWAPVTALGSVLKFMVMASLYIAELLTALHHYVTPVLTAAMTALGHLRGMGRTFERAGAILQGQKDPGHLGEIAGGTFGSVTQGAGPLDGDLERARLIEHYQKNLDATDDSFGPWKRATPAQLKAMGVTPDMLIDENGYRAGIYLDTATGRATVIFANTDPSTKADIIEDAIGAVTFSPQSSNAVRLATAINDSPYGDNTVYTGHSLGGRLAAVAGMTTGNASVAYNAAGVSDPTISYLAAANGMSAEELKAQMGRGQGRVYVTSDDPLTNVQENWGPTRQLPDAPGSHIQLGGKPLPFGSIKGHFIDHVGEEIEKDYPDLR